jgi:hypothetical protein
MANFRAQSRRFGDGRVAAQTGSPPCRAGHIPMNENARAIAHMPTATAEVHRAKVR